MSSLILCSTKLRLPTVLRHFTAQTRSLSVNETANALRPFIFAVHPDLFGRFPKERAVNEDSLKRLNEHIHQLHGQQKVRPVNLTFYVRSQNNNGNGSSTAAPSLQQDSQAYFRPVQIRLTAQNLRDTIKTVLTSCNLSLDYVDNVVASRAAGVQSNAAGGGVAQARTGHDFADNVSATILDRFYGAHAYDQSRIRMHRMARDTLSNWLLKNVDRGRRNLLQMAPTRQEIAKLKEAMISETGATDVQWQCNWTLSSFRTALRGLLRVCRQHSDIVDLKGRTIIFGTDTGVCIQGHVILRHDDVSDSWIVTLKSLSHHVSVLVRIPAAERRLSSLLRNVAISRQPHHPVTMAQDYLLQLQKLLASMHEELSRHGGSVVHGDMTGVQVVIECTTGSLMVTQFGQILVPSSCPAFLIVDFLNSHASEARQIRQEFLRTEKSHLQVVEQCYSKLGLEALTRDANVTRAQMESCCVRLLKLHEMAALAVDLTSCRLLVAQFYSVMSDGDICIPWNFEDII